MKRKEILQSLQEGRLTAQRALELLRSQAGKAAGLSYPLSQAQRGVWVRQKIEPVSSAYNLPVCFRIRGLFEQTVFQEACRFLLDQYPILRTVVESRGTDVLQRIDPACKLQIDSENCSECTDEEIRLRLERSVAAPFRLEHAPLIRVSILECNRFEHIVLIVVHHIVSDAISVSLLVRTLLRAYRLGCRGKPLAPRRSRATYQDFVHREQEYLRSARAREDESFWQARLTGSTAELGLPRAKSRLAQEYLPARARPCTLQGPVLERIDKCRAACGVSVPVFFLTLYKLLLHRYSGATDIVVGMPVSIRPEPRFDRAMGFFVNLLPLRTRLHPERGFAAAARSVQATMSGSLDHQEFPFSLIAKSASARGDGKNPLFQVAYEYQDLRVEQRRKHEATLPPGLTLEPVEGIQQSWEHELVLQVVESAGSIALLFKYDGALFEPLTAEGMAEEYRRLLEHALAEVLDGAGVWQSVWDQFATQASRTPEARAIADERETLDYSSALGRANELACYLRARGVGPGVLVAVYLERSVALPLAMLAILQNGAGFVPLDPSLPERRLSRMVADSGARFVLTQRASSAYMDRIAGSSADPPRIIELEGVGAATNSHAAVTGDLAYVIYTSGSTGDPKGVIIPQRALVNFLLSMREMGIVRPRDRLLAITTCTFDISFLELLLPLTMGAQCCICGAQVARDPEVLRAWISRTRPTVMQATPTTWTSLFQTGWRNEEGMRILCGGEALNRSLAQTIAATSAEAWNLYGPTETTIWSVAGKVDPGNWRSVGKPIANTRVVVLDETLRPLPDGAVGELCIGGDGLASGYLNQNELTASRFIDDPGGPGRRLYRTGDQGVIRPDGSVECFGRIDDQIKLRGHRIEPGEVETHLLELGARHCVVLSTSRAGSQSLTAFCVPKSVAADERALRRELAERLPEQMIPGRFVGLDELPRMASGKVDRAKLRALAEDSGRDCAARDVLEGVCAIWRDLLMICEVDPDAGFVDLGGDSVIAVIASRSLEDCFGVSFSVTDLFDCGTVRAVCARVRDRLGNALEYQRPGVSVSTTESPPSAECASSAAPGDPIRTDVDEYRDSVAIVGISCEFPGAADHRQFWENLCKGVESVEILSPEAARERGVPEAVTANSRYVPVQSRIAGRDCFDAAFFRMTPRDAQLMDPQSRLLLEHAWRAIEDAGLTPEQVSDAGVFVSVSNNGHQAAVAAATGATAILQSAEQYVGYVLSQSGTAAGLISHRLGLRGASFAVHSNCSSGLTGLHVASQSLRLAESRHALVGAASVFPTRGLGYVHQPGLNLSGDGHMRVFDRAANGMIAGEGVAVLLIKRARDAIADGDHIYALIRGMAVNNDGADKAGFYAPGVRGQAQAIHRVLESTRIPAESIGYVEAHGTATEVGDPVEVEALTAAYRRFTQRTQFCGIGSVKSNLGHLDSVAGLAGCIKVALALQRGEIPPTLHFEAPNPAIDFARSPFFVVPERMSWPALAPTRRAGLSAFGIGGTNVHAILEEFGPREGSEDQGVGGEDVIDTTPVVVPISARDLDGLRRQAVQLSTFLRGSSEDMKGPRLVDLAYTLQVGRVALGFRAALVVSTADQMLRELEAYAAGGAGKQGVVFVHAGQPGGIGNALGEADLCELTSKWLATGEVEKLARVWVAGATVDWRLLRRTGRPRRISLPGYPFARDRHLLDESDVSDPHTRGAADRGATRPLELSRRLWAQKHCSPKSAAAKTQRWVLLSQSAGNDTHAQAIRSRQWRFESLAVSLSGNAGKIEECGVQLLELLKGILLRKGSESVHVQLVLACEGADAGSAELGLALAAIFRCAHLEDSTVSGQVILLERPESPARLCELLDENAHTDDVEISYRDGCRRVLEQVPFAREQASHLAPPWKNEGVYWIAGGAGALGRIWAAEILRHAPCATLVLTGRSELDTSRLDALIGDCRGENRQATVEYRAVDIADRAAVEGCVSEILGKHGRLHGVVNAAGVLRDSFIIRKSASEIASVLAPKVAGTVNLDLATAQIDLDIFVLFSSVAAVFGGVGQADYALANAFQDHYARYRSNLGSRAERSGRTLSINWPLWASGGMQLDPVTRGLLQKAGFDALPTQAGFEAFYRALSDSAAQVTALYRPRTQVPAALPIPPVGMPLESQGLASLVQGKLVTLLCEVTRLNPADIDVEAPLERYGIDSIVITELNARLAAPFEGLPRTLFFEYSTLGEVCAFLVTDRPGECARWAGTALSEPAAVCAVPARAEPAAPAAADQCEPIAIIGISGHYPQSHTLEEFWENLKAGRECIEEIPADRWEIEGFFDPEGKTGSYSKWGGFLERFCEFDAALFGISPREARSIDPQERLFLQTCWECFEDAGYTRETLSTRHGGRVGVFAGITRTGFELHGPALWQQGESLFPHTSFGSVANRVSYVFNLNGPSMPVDTMCSASLTAVHEACGHLLRGECELALAGGVHLHLHPLGYLALCSQTMLSKDGHCRSFGRGAEGFVPGEGVGVVLLKRLSSALADGDPIHAVILATSLNHGGKTNGYTVPNPRAQRELIRASLRRAGIPARAVSYVEAHGTGTSLGDPIEIAGLTQAFDGTDKDVGYCAVGSVKSNIGHAESAAGIAGLTKVILQLRHGELAPSLHAAEPNPQIDFSRTPFFVQQHLAPWRRPVVTEAGSLREYPRIAGVSSFGAGGTNAHVIVQEYVRPTAADVTTRSPALIVLSAGSDEQLREQARRLLAWLDRSGLTQGSLPSLAYTLQVGREPMEHRWAVCVDSLDLLRQRLQSFLQGAASDCHRGRAPRLKAVSENTESLEPQELLAGWVLGSAVSWDRLYDGRPPRRISLPTYPFARDRYWLPRSVLQAATKASTVRTRPPGSLSPAIELPEEQTVLFQEHWPEQPLPPAAPGAHAEKPASVVCILCDEGSRTYLSAKLNELSPGLKVFFVPADPAAYEASFAAAHAQLGRVDGLWDLSALEAPELARDLTVPARMLQQLYASPLRCDRILLARSLGSDLDDCYARACIGFEKSVRQWLPDTHVCVIASQGEDTLSAPAAMRDWVLRLWDEQSASSPQSAWYRGARRTVSDIHLCEAPVTRAATYARDATASAEAVRIRDGGTYLITGGAGGLGRLFAHHLVEKYRAKVVLIGRSSVAGAELRRLCLHEGRAGGEICYMRADVCDEARIREVCNEVRRRFGPIRGVIHAAGVLSATTLPGISMAEFAAVLAPKVQGTLALFAALDLARASQPELDFVCSFSSCAEVLGDFGTCAYSMANRFLGAMTRCVARLSPAPRVFAIQWPLWDQGGMNFATDRARELYLQASGQRALDGATGIEWFERLLQGTESSYLVMSGQRARLCRMLAVVEPAPGENPAPQVRQVLESLIQDLMMLPNARRVWRESLADLGFDSIALTKLAKRLAERYRIEFPPSLFFSYPSAQQVAEYLLGRHANEIGARESPVVRPGAALPRETQEPIAIIGMSGRFPGARTVAELWNLLAEGRCAVRSVQEADLANRASTGAGARGESATTETQSWPAALMDGVAEFDPLFFAISPREASGMDPRQRLLLQEAWNALEDAGFGPKQLGCARMGMFVGAEQGDYALLQLRGGLGAGELTGQHDGMLAARLGYFLNFRGPALVLNTSCSSGLVALHQACQSLRNGECDAAIAAAANLLLSPQSCEVMRRAGMLSTTGQCRAFDREADGMVPGEAVIAVVLKRLTQAQADGDPIQAVIRGSGINYDGKTNGITAPNGAAQRELIQEVHARAAVESKRIQYVVAHGTGTRLGDPVEIQALQDVIGSGAEPCALTSTKPSFGHTFAASGLVSLACAVQALRHEQIPASLNCMHPSEHISWERGGLTVNRERRPWPRLAGERRLAAVSAFGMTGTNSHVVLEEPEPAGGEIVDAAALPPCWMLVVSAKTRQALQTRVRDLLQVLQSGSYAPQRLQAISYTLLTGRQHFAHRCAVVVATIDAARHMFGRVLQDEGLEGAFLGEVGPDFVPQAPLLSFAEQLLRDLRDPAAFADAKAVESYRQRVSALAQLFVQGYEPDGDRIFAGQPPKRVNLPGYPFARERYWFEAPTTSRSVTAELSSTHRVPAPQPETYLLHRTWSPRATPDPLNLIWAGRWSRRVVLLDAIYKSRHPDLDAGNAALEVHFLSESGPATAEAVVSQATEMFEHVRRLLLGPLAQPTLLQVALARAAESFPQSSLRLAVSSLLKSACQENPNLTAQVVELRGDETADELAARLSESAHASNEAVIRYSDQQMLTETLEPVTAGPASSAENDSRIPWREGGIYWIVGGSGGLGKMLVREIASRLDEAVVIVSARSVLSETTRAELEGLIRTRTRIRLEFEALDVSVLQEVESCLERLISRHGHLDGIVHAAGIIRDNFAIRKSSEEFSAVLAPKVAGALHLDSATRHLRLQFLVLFSSIAGVWGNAGQCDYAFANEFLDRFAIHRDSLVSRGERTGRTLSVNWPIWADGGMRAPPVALETLRERGLHPLSREDGLKALYRCFETGLPSVVVIHGGAAAGGEKHVIEADEQAQAGPPDEDLGEATLHRLRTAVGRVLALGVDEIRADEALESYGVDSLVIMELNRELAQQFPLLSKSLFYEHRTLRSLRNYLVADHTEGCRRWCGRNVGSEVSFAPRSERGPVAPRAQTPADAPSREPIAIIGISGRYPQAPTLDQFWENLRTGKDCVVEIPPERWSLAGFYDSDVEGAAQRGRSYCKWGGFLERFAEFDAQFFGISPREAQNMDPQERLVLQSCWETLEDAGYTRETLARRHRKRVGVFIGITKTGFDLHGPDLWRRGEPVFPHTSFGSVANRVSFVLDLHGPSMPIDTMCSASLTAVHEACEHLYRQECELAFAGGVNLYLHPSSYVGLCAQRMLSKDGRCRSFGAGADGFVPGEGVGVVLLKPLSAARRDGDRILGVVRGTSVNHGGRTSGYTVPSPNAQRELVEEALRRAGVAARAVSYIEAHGTGTELGDPIEITGLTQAFAAQTDERQFCAIGSVKSNIGHCESAAGIAGLTKVLLQFKHGELVPSLHAQSLSPHIDFDRTPFFVQRQAAPWSTAHYPRIAGISSFGAGGANAHVILEEYLEADARQPDIAPSDQGSPALVLLSARTPEALREQVERLLAAIAKEDASGARLEDIAYTLQIGREAMEYRLALSTRSLQDLTAKLRAHLDPKDSPEGVYSARVSRDGHPIRALGGDEEVRSAVLAWMRRGQHSKLLECWVHGLAIDWGALYPNAPPRLVSLPTYPFAREQHWLPLPARVADTAEADDTTRVLLFEEIWEPRELDRQRAPEVPATIVCVISDEHRRSDFRKCFESLAPRMRVAFIAPGVELQLAGSGPAGAGGSVAHCSAALRRLAAQLGRIDALIDLRGLEGRGQVRDVRGSLYLLQSVARSEVACARILLALATQNPEDECFADAWVALEKSWPRACPGSRVAVICADDYGQSTDATLLWVRRLLDEMQFDATTSVRYRGGQREQLTLKERELPAGGPSRIRVGGTYLITGGAGGIGRLLAQYLIREYAANVVLTGRSALREAQQQSLRELEQFGGSVLYLQADVSDVAQMRAAIAQACERFGCIHGVVHASGLPSSGSVLDRSAEEFAAVWTPKVAGTLALHEALRGRELDFICHFSSASAILGDFGACDYATANRFQNAYARVAAGSPDGAPHVPVTVIDWPLWDEGGMGFDDDAATQLYLRSSGQRALQTQEGIALFERLIAERASQRLVMVGQHQRIRRALGLADAEDPPAHIQADGHPVAQQRICVELQAIAARLLKLEPRRLDPQSNLADFGFDSIGLAELAKQISARFTISLPAAAFFRFPTLARLSQFLAQDPAPAPSYAINE